MPSTRPEQVFNADGICNACLSVNQKKDIDWQARENSFKVLLSKYRSTNGDYDCIIPVSGGKDSCYQAIVMKEKYNMSPLCVNHSPCEMTDVGRKNLEFLSEQGFDIISVIPNKKAYKEMVRLGFFKLGDSCWPEHIGIFTAPVRVSVNYNIPLIIWGENSQFEYGGPAAQSENNFLDRNWLEQFQMLGHRISDVVHEGINFSDIKTHIYPSDEDINRVGVTGLFLGYFEPWDSKRNVDFVEARGWHRNPEGPIDGAYNDIENLDCKWIGGLHDYMKFLKFGYGRATDQLCIEIRAGRMTREQALKEYSTASEGDVPTRYIQDFLDYLNIDADTFHNNLDSFTNKALFCRDENTGKLIKDSKLNLLRKYMPN
jgi:N-acetyl sugar amidotransferase